MLAKVVVLYSIECSQELAVLELTPFQASYQMPARVLISAYMKFSTESNRDK